MTRILRSDICFCDLCGKRTNKSYGRLALTKKNQNKYCSPITIKSWGLCKSCTEKTAGIKCIGEQIKNEIETKLAQLQIEKNPLKLLKD